ncbi:hypothetical protein AIOL_003727 [Candidatus Rhodobacter oscarellae]|uniref:Transglycosylase SLT domain-containing protein n=1 Tax=Candidatus Rhodobacter oscarellae TaxID=1675527 RepID=A0A0J9GZ55_9RHOB|nr:hypothetical protein [Candidatus Rhodobacter lobularis]KMW58748.1 hypothetical protein AIOL_003727 [Candidatus Rhodobacter lobularis]
MRQRAKPFLTFVFMALWAHCAAAFSLLIDPDATGARAPLVNLSGAAAPMPQQASLPPDQPMGRASLFLDRDVGTFFAPLPERENQPAKRILSGQRAPGVTGLRDLIASAEAGAAGYNAVQHGARIKPGKRPTQMTISEIFAWIKATPGQPHAIGRYQIIPSTLRYLVSELGVDGRVVFSPQVQDRMADLLMANAGFGKFRAGKLTRVQFMNNLAKVWAGLPTSKGTSHYHGYAGNYATISWASYEAEMKRLFPQS